MMDNKKATGRKMYMSTLHISRKVVSRRRVFAEKPDDGRQSAETDAGRKEIISNAEEYLAKVRKVLIARVMLRVGVGHK
jgi:hypothetical protein